MCISSQKPLQPAADALPCSWLHDCTSQLLCCTVFCRSHTMTQHFFGAIGWRRSCWARGRWALHAASRCLRCTAPMPPLSWAVPPCCRWGQALHLSVFLSSCSLSSFRSSLAAMLSGCTIWLQAAEVTDAPLLTPLLAVGPRKQPVPAAVGTADSTAAQAPLSKAVQMAAERHQLNLEQAAVLAQVEAWSSPAASQVCGARCGSTFATLSSALNMPSGHVCSCS